MLYIELQRPEKENSALKGLQDLIVDVKDEEKIYSYEELKRQNEDFYGWVSIENTPLNYPVMYTPNDSFYYLRRDFEEQYSIRGVPFLDGEYREGFNNYLIYGHNTDDGTMFAELHKYEDRDYYLKHKIIKFDTLNENGEYEIISVFKSKVYKDDEEGFRYYNYLDLSGQATFEEYISKVKDNSLYDTGVSAKYSDQILTLSTCSYHEKDGRFVVVAKKVSESNR